MDEKVRVVMADQYDLVVGDTFQLYYNSIIEAPNPYCYSIVAICEKGKNFPRYYEYTPTAEGKHKLIVQIYDASQRLLGQNETILNVVKAKITDKKINILCVGASATANGYWVSELHRRLTKTDGEPKGIGCPNIQFVGNCHIEEPGRNEVGFEAFGGWAWNSFTKEDVGAMWIKCDNNRTQEDQHSLWQDENGAIWQLETLQSDYLKFTRYKEHTSPRPQNGTLYHHKNAIDQTPIHFCSSFTEKTSPFLDPETKKISFKTYAERSGISTIDAVYVFLGINGLMRSIALNSTRYEYSRYVVSEAKVFVDRLKIDFPNVKVKIVAPYLLSPNGGMGANYGSDLPFTNGFDIKHYIMELHIAYQEWVNEEGYRDFMELVGMTGQFDAENNYPHIEKPVNTRSKKTERMDTNAAHPTIDGYYQVADAVFRNVVKEFCS